MRKTGKLILAILTSAAGWLVANFALAQDYGINAVNNTINLSQSDPRLIIGRIIQIALSFLGALALVIIMYAGFKWMTSGGEEDKIEAAKKTLRDAIIGLVIILASWAIVTFVLTQLTAVLGGNGNGNQVGAGNGGLGSVGLGAIGACAVDSYYPTDGQNEVPRNTSVMLTFKEAVKLDSVCVNNSGASCACNKTDCTKLNPRAINLYKTDLGNSCNANTNVTDILVSVPSGNKTLVLTPMSYLGSPTSNTPYTIRFTNNIKNEEGNSIFQNCSVNYTEWKFTVSSQLDLTSPIVAPSGVFPIPDNLKDAAKQTIPAIAATGAITVNDCPTTYAAATVKTISPATANVALNYHGNLAQFKIAVPAGETDKAQLFDGATNNLLGVSNFDGNGLVTFPNYLSLTAPSHPAGSLWTVDIIPEQLADTVLVGAELYTFAVNNLNNNVLVPNGACDKNAVALNLEGKLSGNSDIDVARTGNRVNLTAKVAGADGNNLVLQTTNAAALGLRAFSGGVDQIITTNVNDKRDNPMNSVIQINFNEAVNPMTISGTAAELAPYLRIVNADASSSPAAAACVKNSDCQSYKCSNNTCVGDYVGGKFIVSNGYRTVEFLSDNECGVNGCGEKIYCLPANSHLAVKLVAANLKTCTNSSECLPLAPYKNCSSTPLGYQTCQNDSGQNYPTANISSLDGIVDAAMNSLDGNRDTAAAGPISFYSDNYNVNYHPELNAGREDKFLWSFYVNDQIMSGTPLITTTNPAQSQSGLNLADPVAITFNTLMMNSTLRTGSVLIQSGTSTIEHKLINLRSLSTEPLGYWVLNDNLDTAPLDGVPDMTVSKINHSAFSASVSYKAQVGSGVKDIYQNCYKPSAGPNCAATASQPSCCFGALTSTLGVDGNCQ